MCAAYMMAAPYLATHYSLGQCKARPFNFQRVYFFFLSVPQPPACVNTQHLGDFLMRVHDMLRGTGPKPKFAKIWRLCVYFHLNSA